MVAGRSALGWLSLLAPKDGGTQRVLADAPYGRHSRQRLDVYAPRARGEARLPVLFFVYGGGWESGCKADYAFAGHAFAAAGFVTVIADYRIVPEAHYPDFLEDGGLALHWTDRHIAELGGDRDRLFYMGHSAGAYNAVMLGLVGPRHGGPDFGSRLKGVVGLSGPYDFYPFDVPASIAAFSRAETPELSQPVNLVTPDAPPMFLGHGTKDTICGLYNTEHLAAKLRAAGTDLVERRYAGLRHAGVLLSLFPMLRWRAPVYRDVVGFMQARS